MKRHLVYFAIIVFTAVFIFFINFTPVHTKVLLIENVEKNSVHCIIVPQGKFTLSYVHSVHKTPVYEFFEIDEQNQLVLVENSFSSLGVGMPYTEENGTFQSSNGEFKITGLNRKFDAIPIRVSPIPKHTITVGDKSFPLLSYAAPDELVKITAADRWMLVRRKQILFGKD